MTFTALASGIQKMHSHIKWIVEARAGSAAVAQTFLWRILLIFLNLINGILVVRTLGPAGRGQQAMMLQWPQILPSILEFGIPYSIVYYARSCHAQRRSYYGSALLLCLGFSCLAYSIGVLGIPKFSIHFDAVTIRQAQFLMLFAPISMFSFFILAITDSEHAFSLSNALRNVPTLLTTVILSTLVLTHHASPLTTSLAYLAPSSIMLTIVGCITLRRYKPAIKELRQTSSLLFSYGIRAYGSTLVGTFGQQIDQLLVIGLLTPIDLGVYSVALSASRVLNIFPSSLVNVLLPKVVGQKKDEIGELVVRVSRITFVCTILAGICLAAIMPFLMPKLFGSGLIPGIIVSQILILEIVFSSTTWVLLQTYLALNRPAIVTALQGFSLALCLPLMLILIPRLGLPGAALALLISTLIRFTTTILGYTCILKLPIPNLIPSLHDLNYLLQARRRSNTNTVPP